MDLWLDRLALLLPVLARRRAIPAAMRAQQALEAGRTADALARFDVAAALCAQVFPAHSEQHLLALSGLAAALARSGRVEDAEAPLRRQLAIVEHPAIADPLRLAAWTNFAAWCDATARIGEEADAWRTIGALPGANREQAAFSRAVCLRWLDHFDEAHAVVLPLPASPERSLLLARIAAERGRWDEAEQGTREAAEALGPERPLEAIARSRRAVALAELGRTAEAEAETARAEALAGDDGPALRQVYADRARLSPGDAVRWLEAAQAICPDRSNVLALELRVRLALARPDPAAARATLAREVARLLSADHPWTAALR